VNCTAPRYVPDLIRAARTAASKPILVYPNSGERYQADDNTWQGQAEPFGDQAHYWHACGARLIGGCCRTTPADIAEVAAWARQFSPR